MVIFSSSPYFENIYNSLIKAGFKIDLLVTEPPKPAGRGLRLTKNAAHKFAENIGLQVLAPEELNSKSFAKHKIQNTKYLFDIGLIHAYGQIIPQSVINKFEYGILNIHPSLLPKYRGASPIVSAILNNDKKTGYSIILTDAHCDTGKIIAQKQVGILPNDTHDSLRAKIMALAISDLPRIIEDFKKGEIKPRSQNERFATKTAKIKKSDGLISQKDSAQSAFNKIRAYSDWPKAYFLIDGKRIIIHSAKLVAGKINLISLQVEGKNVIQFSDFKHGYSGLLTKFPKFVRITEE